MKVAIACKLDGFANSVRPTRIKAYLEARGHEVVLIDTYAPPASEGARAVARKVLPARIRQRMLHLSIPKQVAALEQRVHELEPDLLICETFESGCVLTKDLPCVKMYDAPAPYADELLYGGRVSKRLYERYEQLELDIYRSADFLSFHWQSYLEYVAPRYQGSNTLVLNWGCTEQTKHARFDPSARIVWLGYLAGPWVNLPLLSALSRIHPIDVYGGPPPDPKWGLTYRGYADLDVLAEYQFGLITISDDPLRRQGFSSKQLEYLSYGLPTLCPDWRHDALLADVTIPFDVDSFGDRVAEHAEEGAWRALHEASLEKARSMVWERQLQPLDRVVAEARV